MAARLDFVAVGDVMLDIRVPAPAGVTLHAPIAVRVGGSAVNAALAAVRAGARAAVVGRIGDDAVGRLVADELVRSGVEALFEIDAHAPTGTAAYVGESVVADRGANANLEAPDLPAARVTLVSGYAPRPDELLRRAHGLRGFDTQGIADAAEADVLIGPGLDLEHPAAAIVCSTLGADGATAVSNGVRVSAAPPRVLDHAPVGAGDTFAATLLLALANGSELGDALRNACASTIGS